MRKCLGLSFIALFVLPYFLLALYVQTWSWPSFSEIGGIFSVTSLQAGLSALGSCALGIVGAYGLLSVRSARLRSFCEIGALAPQIVPTLAVLLAVLNLFGAGAMSLKGTVLVHILLNVGVVSVWWSRVLSSQGGGMAELAYIEGASRLKLCWLIHRYLRRDLGVLFLFVFILCFSSYAIPLVLAGSHALTFEVLIYQKLRSGNGLAHALILSLLQAVFILSITSFVQRSASARKPVTVPSPLLQWRSGLGVLILATGVVFVGLVSGVGRGFHQLSSHPEIWQHALLQVPGTLVVSVGVGFFILFYLYLTAWLWPQRLTERFFLAWVAPSSVLTGLALLLIPDGFHLVLLWLKLAFGLSLVMFPALYRLGWYTALSSMYSQYDVARTLGAGHAQVLHQIIWPQLRKPALLLSGLASFWGAGEFALSQLVAGRDVTLALVIHKLLHSYRLEMALALVWLLIGVGCFGYFLFWSLAHVTSFKSRS